MVTNKSGCCKHLDVGCKKGIILYLNPLTLPFHKQIPEISIDNWWAIYITLGYHIYIILDLISDRIQKIMFHFIQTEQ